MKLLIKTKDGDFIDYLLTKVRILSGNADLKNEIINLTFQLTFRYDSVVGSLKGSKSDYLISLEMNPFYCYNTTEFFFDNINDWIRNSKEEATDTKIYFKYLFESERELFRKSFNELIEISYNSNVSYRILKFEAQTFAIVKEYKDVGQMKSLFDQDKFIILYEIPIINFLPNKSRSFYNIKDSLKFILNVAEFYISEINKKVSLHLENITEEDFQNLTFVEDSLSAKRLFTPNFTELYDKEKKRREKKAEDRMREEAEKTSEGTTEKYLLRYHIESPSIKASSDDGKQLVEELWNGNFLKKLLPYIKTLSKDARNNLISIELLEHSHLEILYDQNKSKKNSFELSIHYNDALHITKNPNEFKGFLDAFKIELKNGFFFHNSEKLSIKSISNLRGNIDLKSLVDLFNLNSDPNHPTDLISDEKEKYLIKTRGSELITELFLSSEAEIQDIQKDLILKFRDYGFYDLGADLKNGL